MKDSRQQGFDDLLDLLRFLRSKEGCLWDRSKGPKEMKPYLLEECHELLEAIDGGDTRQIMDELGDLLLHCAFMVTLGEENGDFTPGDVFSHLVEKIKRRHQGLFNEGNATRTAESWEYIKDKERRHEGRHGIIDGIPPSLPSLMRSYRLQERVSALNFDWSSPEGAMGKVSEELGEVKNAYRSSGPEEVKNEVGDLLFAVVNLARLLEVHPEEALAKTIDKFAGRFDLLRSRAEEAGLVIGEASLEELDLIWESIKKERGGHGAPGSS